MSDETTTTPTVDVNIAAIVSEAMRQAGFRPQMTKSMTLQELYAIHYRLRVVPKQLNQANYRYFWAKANVFADRQIHMLKRQEILAWFIALSESSGRSMANRTLVTMSALVNWGIRQGILPADLNNPCKGIERFREESRERFLSVQELQKLFGESLAQEPRIWQDFFRICLLTGSRRGNVQSMRWDELNLDSGVWTIPASKSKNKRALRIALSAAAVAILNERKRLRTSEWVFPGRAGSKTGHVNDVKRAWARITKRAGITDITPHDLRRTLGSQLAIEGTSLPVIGAALGHLDQRSTAIYARLNLDPVREASERVNVVWKDVMPLSGEMQPSPTTVRASDASESETGDSTSSRVQQTDKDRTISQARQIAIEARILKLLKRVKTANKKDIYKVASKTYKYQLSAILSSMEARGLIKLHRDEANQSDWHAVVYTLVEDAYREPQSRRRSAPISTSNRTQVDAYPRCAAKQPSKKDTPEFVKRSKPNQRAINISMTEEWPPRSIGRIEF